MKQTDVAIIGAGPYGLSIAAHLAARGVDFRIFGKPMQFWSDIAKAGGQRYLKSFCFGTSLSSPRRGFCFVSYNRARGLETFEPCSMQNFTEYGSWFQEQQVPNLEFASVTGLCRNRDGYSIALASGERFAAKSVIVATGLANFAQIPSFLHSLPRELVRHTSEVTNFAAFKGRRVAVIGGGQSALEAAALLLEAGAYPELFVRKEKVRWHGRASQKQSLWKKLRSPITGLGTGPKAWVLTNFPEAAHHMPESWRTQFVKRHLPPEGAWWLRDRVEEKLPIHLGTAVVEASPVNSHAKLQLHAARNNRTFDMEFDHVISGSGFHIDLAKLPFLDSALSASIQTIEGSPRLNSTFECSVPRLRFVGPLSAMSFGPMFRFVIGVTHTAEKISSQLHR